jgi:tetratricopeptide (TPR) repeat protein
MNERSDESWFSVSSGFPPPEKTIRAKKLSRIITSIILVMFGLYHIGSQYYEGLNSRLFIPSPNGIMALMHYELGQYKEASRCWRLHYGLSFAPSIDSLKSKLNDQLVKEPENHKLYLLLADLYFYTEDYSDASAMYTTALKKNKYSYDAKVGLASTLVMQGELKQSCVVFADLLKSDYDEKNITSFLNFLVALDKLERAKSIDSADLYLTLAYAYRYLSIVDVRKQKNCIYYSDKTILIDSKLEGAYFCKGVMYIRQEKYDDALKQFLKVAEINPSHADTYNRLGYIYGMQGNLGNELESYKKAVELGGDNPTFAYNLGLVLQNKYGDSKQASNYFEKAFELNPADFKIISMYGYTTLMAGDFTKTLKLCDTMITNNPTRPYGYKLKADCFMRLRKYQDAIKLYLQSYDVANKSGTSSLLDFNAFGDLAIAYTQLNKLDDAIAAYQKAIKINPYDVDALFALQTIYRRKSRYKEAYMTVKEILRIQPNHSGAQRVLPYLQQNIALENRQ